MMDDREWMYTGWFGKRDWTDEFIQKVEDFMKKLLSKDRVKLCVLAVSVQTRYFNHSSIWVKTFAPMSLWQTIPGESIMVKPIVRETRS